MTEREAKTFTNKVVAEVEEVAGYNQMLAMAARMAGRGGRGGRGGGGRGAASSPLPEWLRLNEDVPKLHEEFAKAGR